MKKFIEKPYLIFVGIIPVVLLIGLFGKDEVIDVGIHDTYFIIYYPHVTYLITVLFFCFALGYFLVEKLNGKLIGWMSLLHTIITIFGILTVLFLFSSYGYKLYDDYLNYYYPSNIKSYLYVGYSLYAFVFSLVFVQLLYIINILIGVLGLLFKKN